MMRRTFALPALCFALGAFGLAASLLGDGAWDVIGTLALAAPLGAIVWGWLKRT